MPHHSPFTDGLNHAAAAAASPAQLIRQTQAALNTALDALVDSTQTLREDVTDLGRSAESRLHDGLAAVRHSSQVLMDQARAGSASAQTVIRHDPLKSVLIAAASGAALMALVNLLSRPTDRS